MKIVWKTLDALEFAVIVLCVATVVVMSVSTTLQVFGRYFMTVPLPWTEELSRRMMSWVLFLATPIAYRKNGQLGIDLLIKKFPKHLHNGTMFVIDTLIALFGGLMIVQGMLLAQKAYNQMSSALGISMYYVYLVIPFSGFLIVLFAAERLLKLFFPVAEAKGAVQ